MKDSKILHNESEKFDYLFQIFFSGRYLSDHQFDENWEKLVRKNIHREQITPDEIVEENEMNRSISMNEIDNAISKMKVSNKSADPDIIYPLMLKKSGFLFRAALLRLYELSFDTGKWV